MLFHHLKIYINLVVTWSRIATYSNAQTVVLLESVSIFSKAPSLTSVSNGSFFVKREIYRALSLGILDAQSDCYTPGRISQETARRLSR